jgi:type II secretory pathway pseudopilin PulG
MAESHPIRRPIQPAEQGYVLLAVIFLVALLTISLALAMPKVAKDIQRDRDLETMHRGKQYIRAIRMYHKKFGAYPMNADALVKPTNNIRYLRKKYADPTTGKEDWKPVLVGMNKAPTAMGFFGQPLGGIGGCAPINPLGTSTPSVPSSLSSFGGTTGSGTPGSPTDSNSNCAGTGLNTSTTSATGISPTNPSGPNAASSSADTSSNTSAFGQPGQTFGGAGIMGFSPNSPKKSIMVYKTKTHYNEWEFVYDPRADLMQMPGGGAMPINNNPAQTGAASSGLPPTPSGSGSNPPNPSP